MDHIGSMNTEDEDAPDYPANQTVLERRGLLDLSSMIKRRNSKKSVEFMMEILYEWPKGYGNKKKSDERRV